jgi:hypothetical protein
MGSTINKPRLSILIRVVASVMGFPFRIADRTSESNACLIRLPRLPAGLETRASAVYGMSSAISPRAACQRDPDPSAT